MSVFLIPTDEPLDEFVGAVLLRENQAKLAKKYGIQQFEKPTPDAQIRSIGFNPTTQTWYGWSHRAIAGFKVGDTVKKNDVIADGVAANLRKMRDFPVGFTAKTLQDCRDMAAKFSEEVS